MTALIWIVIVSILWPVGSFSASAESTLATLTNKARVETGLNSLRIDSTLAGIARWRSQDMIENDYFSHDIPGGGNVIDVLQRRGYCFNVAGENIGWNNYPDDLSAGAVAASFLKSSGHRGNVLDKRWDVMGVGAFKGPTGKKMYTVIFADKCSSKGGKTIPLPATDTEPERGEHEESVSIDSRNWATSRHYECGSRR